jgi:hypothetical protein
LQLFDGGPKPIAIPFLRFNSQRRFNNPNADLFRKVRSFAQDLIFEIGREFVIRHAGSVSERKIADELTRRLFAPGIMGGLDIARSGQRRRKSEVKIRKRLRGES